MTPAKTISPQASEAELLRIERLAERMDSAFRIPMTGIRIGWDSILGLIPGVGDTAALLPAAYILHKSYRLGAPPAVLGRMGINTAADWLLGSIPLVGDIFDIGFKGNRRNAALLRKHLQSTGHLTQTSGSAKTV
ncbi:protein of unknown function [Poseidonocella pacifica]|uniref:DUF4112 domain-containing protein n=1 Tax=Poseidonocella pacifica TaxID=871651 RepID=A0A1I0YKP8_9RHOB|nr:DUF4112 domain-containing protein [Poseidonocella pacifica]SFB13040.1 protein of unknown function [Poseidonocella pacifica]